MASQHDFQLRLGLRIIKFVPEFHNYTMTEMAHYLSHNTTSIPSPTLSKVSSAISDYLGPSYAHNTSSVIKSLDVYLSTLPHGQNDLVWHYPFGIAITVVTGLLTLMRLHARWVMGGKLKVEDWSIVTAMLMSVGITALMENSTKFGGGWYVIDVSWEKIARFMRCAYMCPYFYAAGVFCVKLSLLLFYRRLSPRKWFQVGVLVGIAFVCCLFLSTFIAMFFQCTPLTQWENPFADNCFDVVAFWTAYGVLNMFSDFWIWLLPVSVVWRLKLKTKEKVQVILLFGLGLLVCAAAAARILTLRSFVHNPDITSGEAPNGVWSLIELNCGIICACIPACKAYFSSAYAPTIFLCGRKPSLNSEHMAPDPDALATDASEKSKGGSDGPKGRNGHNSKWSVTDSWLSTIRGRDEEFDEEVAVPPRAEMRDRDTTTQARASTLSKTWRLPTVKESKRESKKKRRTRGGVDEIEPVERQDSLGSDMTDDSGPPSLPVMDFEYGQKRDSRGWMI